MTRKAIQSLLNSAAEAQSAYWSALGALETALGIVLDDVPELDGISVQDLRDIADNCGDGENGDVQ